MARKLSEETIQKIREDAIEGKKGISFLKLYVNLPFAGSYTEQALHFNGLRR